MENAPEILKIIPATSIFLSIALGAFTLLHWRRFDKTQRTMGRLLLFAAVIEITAYVLGRLLIMNLPLLHLYTVVEFSIIVQLFSYQFPTLRKPPVKWSLIGGFLLIALGNAFIWGSVFGFNDIARSLESFLICIFCLWYFYDMLRRLPERYPEKTPMFWINIGLLIYFAASLFIFIFSNYVLSEDDRLSLLSWNVHGLLTITRNVFYAIAISIKADP